MSEFVQQCVDFEDGMQQFLLTKGRLHLQFDLPIPEDFIHMVQGVVARFIGQGVVAETDRKILEILIAKEISEFECRMEDIQPVDQKGYRLTKVERDTLSNFIMHIIYISFSRQKNGDRRKDFAALEADQYRSDEVEEDAT